MDIGSVNQNSSIRSVRTSQVPQPPAITRRMSEPAPVPDPSSTAAVRPGQVRRTNSLKPPLRPIITNLAPSFVPERTVHAPVALPLMAPARQLLVPMPPASPWASTIAEPPSARVLTPDTRQFLVPRAPGDVRSPTSGLAKATRLPPQTRIPIADSPISTQGSSTPLPTSERRHTLASGASSERVDPAPHRHQSLPIGGLPVLVEPTTPAAGNAPHEQLPSMGMTLAKARLHSGTPLADVVQQFDVKHEADLNELYNVARSVAKHPPLDEASFQAAVDKIREKVPLKEVLTEFNVENPRDLFRLGAEATLVRTGKGPQINT